MRQSDKIASTRTGAIEELSVPEGVELYGAARAPRGVYLIRSGYVRLYGADQVVLDNLKPGSVFGEKSFLAHPARKRQSAIALSPAKVALFLKSGLRRQVQDDPQLATRIMKGLAERLDTYEQAIRDLVREPSERRLAYLLLRLSPGRRGWVRVRFLLSNRTLADMVGASSGRISRLLTRFQKWGWLRRQEGLWIQREGLQRYLKKR